MKQVFRSQRVVLPEGMRPAVVEVEDGVIVRIADFDDSTAGGGRLTAVDDLVLMPGVVDTHVHVNEPGRTDWEGFASATRAAAAGGVTSLIDMPLNSKPPTTADGGLRKKQKAAVKAGLSVDVGLWGGVVPGNARELEKLWAGGVCGFKAFLSPSGVDEFENVTEADLREALPILARLDAPLLVHAELPEFLLPPADDSAAGRRRYANYLTTRPARAEEEAISLLIRLAGEFKARVHIVHLATTSALSAISTAKRGGVRITVETCPHYLHFKAEEIGDGRTEFKCAPPIRGGVVREVLWRSLKDGGIDLIASDHSPCPPAMKLPESGDFLAAWGGIASLQLALPVVWTGAERRGASLLDVCRLMCEGPARLAGLPQKGRIAVGCDADFVAFDPSATWTVDGAKLEHRHKITPYQGETLTGMVRATFVRGECVFRDGAVVGTPSGRILSGRGTASK